jgi:voltage-gated potassium channel
MTHNSNNERLQQRERWFAPFLLSTLLPILVAPFTNMGGNLAQQMLLPLSVVIMVLIAARIIPNDLLEIGSWKPYRLYRPWAAVCCCLMGLPYLLGEHMTQGLHALILSIISSFYLATAIALVLILAKVHRMNEAVLCLGAAGYVHLGLTGGQLATALEMLRPGSFNLGRMLHGQELVERLSYFSFVTVGTLGYGDVLPTTTEAESFSVLLSATGALYVTLIIGLLLSRYITTKQQH